MDLGKPSPADTISVFWKGQVGRSLTQDSNKNEVWEIWVALGDALRLSSSYRGIKIQSSSTSQKKKKVHSL